jgi:probable F420-dependent oxidoreductase
MKFGVSVFPTDYSMPITDVARAAEEHGFESMWVPEHTHIPSGRATPWPGGGELPREYSHTLDPFVALAAASSVTSTLRLGFGICLLPQRDPLTTAKAVATLDHVSGGRVDFGVGAGWNREELENHGGVFDTRFRLLRERLAAMKQMWTSDEAEYHGTLVDFDAVWSWPKPVQKPHPPVFVGGSGPSALRRVVEYGDEWMPIRRPGFSHEERIPELQQLAAEAGRPPIPVTFFYAPTDPAEIERLASRGVTRFLFGLPSADAEATLARLHQLSGIVSSLS